MTAKTSRALSDCFNADSTVLHGIVLLTCHSAHGAEQSDDMVVACAAAGSCGLPPLALDHVARSEAAKPAADQWGPAEDLRLWPGAILPCLRRGLHAKSCDALVQVWRIASLHSVSAPATESNLWGIICEMPLL